jgi:hypothetical protein
MNIRLATAALALSLFSLVACSAPAEDADSQGANIEKGDEDESGEGGNGKETASNDDTDNTPSDKEVEPEEPADPACVATCTQSVKAKCEGDETFCESICRSITSAQLACLVAATSCTKSDFIACVPPSSDNDTPPSGEGSGGK